MGWTGTFASSFAEMKKQYIVELTASGRIKMVSTYGNWFHCINTATDRPFVIYMLTSSRNHEYAYKDMSSDMGFFQLNYRAASWLKRELMKRNMAPLTKYEADWILRSERKERFSKLAKIMSHGDILTLKAGFQTQSSTVEDGEIFTYEYVDHGKREANLVAMRKKDHRLWRLRPSDFRELDPEHDFLPVPV